MQNGAEKPELRVTVFSDYICPFCYIGDARLDRLRDEYDLRVNWCFLEIHPETPAEGMPVSELGYDEVRWREMMEALARMAKEENLAFAAHDFTTNSRSALLLAEAAKEEGQEIFYSLHRALFEAFFRDQLNIGDTEVLARLAHTAGVSADVVEQAWCDARFKTRLQQNLAAARELGVQATPTFFLGQQRLDGAVTMERLRQAARAAVAD